MTQKINWKKIATLPKTEQQIHFAAILSAAFKKKNITLTVVGGSAVQFYTDANYTTKDLDAVLYGDDKASVEEVMNALGFKRSQSYRHFEHPKLNFVVEFPPDPVAVGSKIITKINLIKMNSLEVRVIRIEDILMDRIIGAIEWKSEKYHEQAKLLWKKNKDLIDLKYLKNFAKEEGYTKELNQIIKT
ncbi:MAG: hypothetical protein H7A33_08035 [Deltaproteobacteria bacterium]|nr:hypothetical protein [Deltaproteobacteria bacterium]